MKKSLFVAFLFIASLGFAQSNKQTLEDKWNQTLNKAENYEHYKVIKKVALTEMWTSVQDTVKLLKANLQMEKDKIRQQEALITGLKKELADSKFSLETTKGQKDNMGFLGMSVNKYTYSTLLWIMVIMIAGGSAVLYFLYMNSNKVTIQKIKEYNDLSTEFEEYKKAKIEMERKLKRDLQTQMNKAEELKNLRR